MTQETLGPDMQLEFPEIQLVPKEDPTDNKNPSHLLQPPGQQPSEAKKQFGRLAMKVLTNIVVNNDRSRESPIPEQEDETEQSDSEDSQGKQPSSSSKLNPSKPASFRSSRHSPNTLTPRKSDSGPESSSRRRSSVQITEGDGQPSARKSSSLAPTSKFQFASLVRLAKFRRMAGRIGDKSSRTSSRRTSISEVEEEEPLPETPRFCATLSPEAQYAMMKGYEDVLIQHIKTNHKTANFLLRVKTPHQKVTAIHLADQKAGSEPPSKGQADSLGHLRLPRQESLLPATPHSDISSTSGRDTSEAGPTWRAKTWTLNSPGPMSRRTSSEAYIRQGRSKTSTESMVNIPKERQLKLSSRFQKAMDILDTLKDTEGLPVTSLRDRRCISNPVANYNTWSQSWSREFKFQYTPAKS